MYHINEGENKIHGHYFQLWLFSYDVREEPYMIASFATRKSVLKLIHYLNGGSISMNHEIKYECRLINDLGKGEEPDIVEYLTAEEMHYGYTQSQKNIENNNVD